MRVQPQPMIDVLAVDIAQKILISGDAERWRTAAPLDLKPAIGLNFGKIADRSSVSDDMTITHDAAPAAAGRRKKEASQESDRYLIHNSTLADEMTSAPALDSYFLNLQLVG
jgi:hypothetical protein